MNHGRSTSLIVVSLGVLMFSAGAANGQCNESVRQAMKADGLPKTQIQRICDKAAKLASQQQVKTEMPVHGSNRKLFQDNAEKAIRQVIANHTVSHSAKEAQFNLDSIVRIGPVSQFSETEASTIVKFKDSYTAGMPFALKFVFQKNVDNKWILTKLGYAGPPDGSPLETSGHESMIIEVNQNLNVVAQ